MNQSKPSLSKFIVLVTAAIMLFSGLVFAQEWEPLADWGHWRLGQKSDLDFLQKNNMTITFGSGAPNFEYVTRAEFDKEMEEAKAFNRSYHDKGYIVLRYLSSSLNGKTKTNTDIPQKDQIDFLDFYNSRWSEFTDYIGPKPPEDPTTWITVRADGTFPYYRYAPYGKEKTERFETWGCPNNPYYVRMMEGRIRAQAETGIDGSYVDWTHIAGETCYCDYTRKAFIDYLTESLPAEVAKEKYGTSDYENITLPKERGDYFWMEWITFRGRSVAEFHRRLRTVARKYNPHFMISGNVFGGFGYGPVAYDAAGNMEMLGAEGYDDFIYSEMQEFLDSAPRRDSTGTKITNSPALKFLTAAAHNKPIIVYATEITPPIFPNSSEKVLSAMAQINIAEAEANHTIFREKRQTPPGATRFYQFLSANEKDLVDAKLTSNIGILASLNQYLADELSFAFSASRVLADEGIAHVMLVENDLLSGKINDIDLVMIPYLPLLSVEKQQALKNYVENGGVLLVLGESGRKNQYNVPNDRLVLAEVLGEKDYPESYVEKTVGKGKIAYIPVTIPSDRFLVQAKEKGEFTTFGPTMADVFSDIPEAYTRNNMDPDLRKILKKAGARIRKLIPEQISMLTKKTPYIEMTTMTNDEENLMLVHLVNYDVTLDGTITPARDLQIQLSLPTGKKVKSVKFSGTLSDLQPLDFDAKQKAGKQVITFEPDKVEVYGLAVVRFE
ncbi:MAG: beta-galactosidase [Candidatus Marinimicrobia bacterium]|nr:beta-galactosidase [Candidatus Neomarinimicrobiota bacterium]